MYFTTLWSKEKEDDYYFKSERPVNGYFMSEKQVLQVARIHLFLSANSCETVFLPRNSSHPLFSCSKEL